MKHSVRFLLGLVIAALAANLCGTARADAPATFDVSGFTFTRPASWEWVEVTTPMRKAQLRVKSADGKETADVVFFQFGPGAAGGVQANVERWFRQFSEPRDKINAKTEDATVNGHKVTYAQAEGTYQSGMPGGAQTPMPEYALLGAIIESDSVNIFVKMTGPKALVKSATPDFKKMVESGLK